MMYYVCNYKLKIYYLNTVPLPTSGVLVGCDKVNDPGYVLHYEVSMREVILRTHTGQHT